MAYKLAKRCE